MLSLQNIMDVKLLSIKNATKYQHDAFALFVLACLADKPWLKVLLADLV